MLTESKADWGDRTWLDLKREAINYILQQQETKIRKKKMYSTGNSKFLPFFLTLTALTRGHSSNLLASQTLQWISIAFIYHCIPSPSNLSNLPQSKHYLSISVHLDTSPCKHPYASHNSMPFVPEANWSSPALLPLQSHFWIHQFQGTLKGGNEKYIV